MLTTLEMATCLTPADAVPPSYFCSRCARFPLWNPRPQKSPTQKKQSNENRGQSNEMKVRLRVRTNYGGTGAAATSQAGMQGPAAGTRPLLPVAV